MDELNLRHCRQETIDILPAVYSR